MKPAKVFVTISASLFWFVSLLPAQTPPVSASATNARANPLGRRGVSWVNPKLPAGTGLTHHVLASAALSNEVGYVVWTPPGYDPGKKYPVLYFLHGAGGNESGDSAGFSGWVAKGIEKGEVPPVIVVFPNGGMSGYRGAVEKMIVEELIPLIDKNYPTLASAESRAVAGFSMGGAGAVRLSLMHPELFAAASSWGGNAGPDLGPVAEKNAEALKKRGFGLLLINGEKDRPDAFKSLAQKLDTVGVANQIVILPGLEHNLGRYYELSYDQVMKFLGDHLKK